MHKHVYGVILVTIERKKPTPPAARSLHPRLSCCQPSLARPEKPPGRTLRPGIPCSLRSQRQTSAKDLPACIILITRPMSPGRAPAWYGSTPLYRIPRAGSPRSVVSWQIQAGAGGSAEGVCGDPCKTGESSCTRLGPDQETWALLSG